ncbi:nuclear distribution protein nudE homolog 1 isoform X2 [Planococcus citri]|uniref:nuclear distribution protein nudE homolog 1 isoform X2 n=1 Tax=Planococcus citri TaxID=170843 RepID=UPI0031F7ED3A
MAGSEFASVQDEVNYWRDRCEETEREYEEFRQNSHLLEKELEISLEQAEKANRELKTRNNHLVLENETLKKNYHQEREELVKQIAELQEESKRCHSREEDYVKYIRSLEQKNDDLERSQRVTYESLAEFELKLNSAIERNVLLESELDEKENLKATVQRLKDETRDLRQEIQVREKELRPDNDKATATRRCSSFRVSSSTPPSNDIPSKRTPLSSDPSKPHTHIKSLSGGHSVLTTPTRVSAMNIVGDLLRKVGALESKLASCRMSPADNTRESFRGRSRLNRGVSTPSIHNLVRS